MATTAVLHANANDAHKADQSPHSIHTSSPHVRGFSPNQSVLYNIPGVSPTEGTTPTNCSNSTYQQASYPLPPTRDGFQDLTPEPPAVECTPQVEVCSANFIGSSPCAPNGNSDVVYIRDPFYEQPRKRIPNDQQPMVYGNTGNPLVSGVRLELPRNVRVPYPESAHEAASAMNKNYAASISLQSSAMCMPQRPRPMPYMTAPQRGMYPNAMNPCGVSPSYPAPTPSPSGMSPSYMHQVRAMGKPCSSQMPAGPYAFPNVPYGANNVMPNMKKNPPATGGRRGKQSKAAVEERAAKTMRKNEFNAPCGNMYDQVGDMGRPSTSAANFGPMPAVMGGNPANMGGQPPLTPSPPTSQMMMMHGARQYQFEGPPMNNNHMNMQVYEQMQPMNQNCSGLMQPPPLPVMRPNGHMNNVKPGVDVTQMPKPAIFPQSSGMNPEMGDGIRMFDGRSMVKNPQYQMNPLASNQPEVYGNMNGSIPSSSGYPQPNSIRRLCGFCREALGDAPVIQCTGNGQGCLRYFHEACSQMTSEPFHAILNEPRAEWICNSCSKERQIVYS